MESERPLQLAEAVRECCELLYANGLDPVDRTVRAIEDHLADQLRRFAAKGAPLTSSDLPSILSTYLSASTGRPIVIRPVSPVVSPAVNPQSPPGESADADRHEFIDLLRRIPPSELRAARGAYSGDAGGPNGSKTASTSTRRSITEPYSISDVALTLFAVHVLRVPKTHLVQYFDAFAIRIGRIHPNTIRNIGERLHGAAKILLWFWGGYWLLDAVRGRLRGTTRIEDIVNTADPIANAGRLRPPRPVWVGPTAVSIALAFLLGKSDPNPILEDSQAVETPSEDGEHLVTPTTTPEQPVPAKPSTATPTRTAGYKSNQKQSQTLKPSSAGTSAATGFAVPTQLTNDDRLFKYVGMGAAQPNSTPRNLRQLSEAEAAAARRNIAIIPSKGVQTRLAAAKSDYSIIKKVNDLEAAIASQCPGAATAAGRMAIVASEMYNYPFVIAVMSADSANLPSDVEECVRVCFSEAYPLPLMPPDVDGLMTQYHTSFAVIFGQIPSNFRDDMARWTDFRAHPASLPACATVTFCSELPHAIDTTDVH